MDPYKSIPTRRKAVQNPVLCIIKIEMITVLPISNRTAISICRHQYEKGEYLLRKYLLLICCGVGPLVETDKYTLGSPGMLKYQDAVWESEVAQSCLTLCGPMDCSLPGSSIHRIFQARVLEWVAICGQLARQVDMKSSRMAEELVSARKVLCKLGG